MGILSRINRFFSRPHTRRAFVYNKFRWRYAGQWKVGEDSYGNEYFLYQPFEETPIRRFCLYKDGDTGTDTMPFLWYQWVRYQREYPPTDEELVEYDEYLEEMKQKALEVEAKDQALRSEEIQFINAQREAAEAQKKQNTLEAQQEIISMFAEREKALRIAAENKLAKVKEVEDALKAQKEQHEKLHSLVILFVFMFLVFFFFLNILARMILVQYNMFVVF